MIALYDPILGALRSVGGLDCCPPVSPTFRNSDYGRYLRLDDDYTTIDFSVNLREAKKLILSIQSADSTVIGNIAVKLVKNGVTDETATVIPVTASATEVILSLGSWFSGTLSITRDHANVLDTLQSVGAPEGDADPVVTIVSAVITDVKVLYA